MVQYTFFHVSSLFMGTQLRIAYKLLFFSFIRPIVMFPVLPSVHCVMNKSCELGYTALLFIDGFIGRTPRNTLLFAIIFRLAFLSWGVSPSVHGAPWSVCSVPDSQSGSFTCNPN